MSRYTYRVKACVPNELPYMIDNIIFAGFCFVSQRGEEIYTVEEFIAQKIPIQIIRAQGVPISIEWSQTEVDVLIITSLLHDIKKDIDLSFYIRCTLKIFKGLYIDNFKAERLEATQKLS